MLKETIKTIANCIIKNPKPSILPYNIVIENTNRCNLICQHCWRKVVKNPTDMSFNLYKKIIDEIMPKKVNILGNGEPFMHPEAFKFFEYAKMKNCLVYTSTNGTLINRQKAEQLIDLHVDSIGISIDAARKETYAKIRGGDLNRVFDAIGYLTEAKLNRGYKDINIGAAFLIQNDNFDEIEEFAKRINQYKGINFISYQRLKFLSEELKKNTNFLGEITYEKIREKINEIRKWTKITVNYDEHVAEKMWNKNILSCGRSFTKRCIQPWYSVYITASGDVLPCCFFSATTDTSIGNITKCSFKEIWNSEKYANFRIKLNSDLPPHEICAECYPFKLSDYFKIEKRFIKMMVRKILNLN